jgi:uncharacterized cupin superfamily protein
MAAEIIAFKPLPAPEATAPDPTRLLSGTPRQRTWNVYSDPGARFHAGQWASSPGRWRVRYTEHEFCCLLEGHVAIESESGIRTEFRAGDAFVVPQGFAGTWSVLEPTVKLYVIYEPG